MTPASPVVPGADLPEVVYAKDQKQYLPLPAHRLPDGTILTRWRLTWPERFLIFLTGNLYLWVKTFHQPLQPLAPTVRKPEVTLG